MASSSAAEDEEEESGTAITDRVDHLSILSQLHQHCPQLALGFQKQSVTLLEVGDEGEREEYTDLFGQVFTSPSLSSHRPDTVAHFSQLFAMLLNRFHDVSAKIRVRIAQHAGNLLIAHGQIESQKEIIQSQHAHTYTQPFSASDKGAGVGYLLLIVLCFPFLFSFCKQV